MLPTPIAFDSVPVTFTDTHHLGFPQGGESAMASSPILDPVMSTFPVYEGLQLQSRTIDFEIWPGSVGYGGTIASWTQTAAKTFQPWRGPKTLRATWDGVTFVTAQAVVIELKPPSEGTGYYRGKFLLSDPVWRIETVNGPTASPVTVSGNIWALPTLKVTTATATITSSSVANPTTLTFAAPHGWATGDLITIAGHTGSTPAISGFYQITVTGASTATIPVNVSVGGTGGTAKRVIKRARCTITDTQGEGLSGHPFRLTIDTSASGAAAAADFIVFVNRQSVPFFVQGIGTASTLVDFDITTTASGTVIVDVFFGAQVNNTVTANAYQPGGRYLDHASYSNTTWVYRVTNGTLSGKLMSSSWDIARQARKVGTWSFGKFAEVIPGINFGFVPGANAAFAVGPSNGFGVTLKNDADGLILVCQCGADASNALKGLNVAISGATDAVLVIEYMRPGDTAWTPAGGSIAAGWDVDGASKIRIYIRPTSTSAQGTITFQEDTPTAPLRLVLASATVPTAGAVTYTAARVINGTITHAAGNTITFPDVYSDDQELTITCLMPRTIVSASGPFYNDPLPSHPEWFPLDVGSNSWTVPAGVAVTATWQNRLAA